MKILIAAGGRMMPLGEHCSPASFAPAQGCAGRWRAKAIGLAMDGNA